MGPPRQIRSALLGCAAIFALLFEMDDLTNTLECWSLVRTWGGAGLVLAALFSWLGRRPFLQGWRSKALFERGTWWHVLPLVFVASASFINHQFLAEELNCRTWPIDHVSTRGRNASISVSWAGNSTELAMPRSAIEQLTTSDSLRCWFGLGALQYTYVFRIEPVIVQQEPH
jgi:hypothetical protein